MSDTQPPAPPPVGEAPPGPPRPFLERLMGALKLDASVYEEVEHDPDALPQALGVVALAAVCGGIGSAGYGGGAILAGVFAAVIGWLVSAGVIWLVGVRLFEHTSDYGELLRTIGFAQAPQLVLVLAAIPVFGVLVRLVVFGWGLVAYVVAVRQALDVETGRAVFVCLLAWGLVVVLTLVFSEIAVGCGGHGAVMP